MAMPPLAWVDEIMSGCADPEMPPELRRPGPHRRLLARPDRRLPPLHVSDGPTGAVNDLVRRMEFGMRGNVPRQATGMAGYADYLAGFITELGLERPHVAGLSFGGALAIELARRHPTIPRTLILVSAYAGWAGSLPAVVGGRCRCSSTTSSRRGFPSAAGHVAPGSAGPSPTTDR